MGYLKMTYTQESIANALSILNASTKLESYKKEYQADIQEALIWVNRFLIVDEISFLWKEDRKIGLGFMAERAEQMINDRAPIEACIHLGK